MPSTALCASMHSLFFSSKLINAMVVLPLQLTHGSLLDKLHCLALQTAAVTSTLVLVFYWAYATGPNQSPLPGDHLKYAANVPLLLLNVFFSKLPFVSHHLQVIYVQHWSASRLWYSSTGCLDCNVVEYQIHNTNYLYLLSCDTVFCIHVLYMGVSCMASSALSQSLCIRQHTYAVHHAQLLYCQKCIYA